MNTNFDKISELLLEEISKRFNNEPINIEGLEFSESFAEMLDRFVVLHIRMWKLEDAIVNAKNDQEIADLKKKIDFCFKEKRPKLTKAINFFLDCYVDKTRTKKFSEENIKFYNGYKN